MIKLDVKDCCENCGYFKPTVDKSEYHGRTLMTNYKVVCENRALCRRLYEHLEKVNSGENVNGN